MRPVSPDIGGLPTSRERLQSLRADQEGVASARLSYPKVLCPTADGTTAAQTSRDRCTLIARAGGEERDPRVRDTAVGKVAQVVHRVRGTAGPGEICVMVGGTYETYLAYSDGVLERGTEALIISSHSSGSYDVVPWPDTTAGLELPAAIIDPPPGPDAHGVAGTTER